MLYNSKKKEIELDYPLENNESKICLLIKSIVALILFIVIFLYFRLSIKIKIFFKSSYIKLQKIQTKIYEVKENKVMLNFDLAELYEVQTKNLNLYVKRNLKRFPKDFMFQITKPEWEGLRLQIETSNARGGTRYLPYAFTEQGLAMLSGVLNSDKAIEANIAIMSAFIFIRQYAFSHTDLTEKLKELETKYNKQFNDVYEALNYLLNKDKQETAQKERKKIGYK